MPEQEHAVATEYLAGVYREGSGPEIRRGGGATVAGEPPFHLIEPTHYIGDPPLATQPFPRRSTKLYLFYPTTGPNHGRGVKLMTPTCSEVLVRELQGLGEALREREGELGVCSDRMENAVSDAKAERAR